MTLRTRMSSSPALGSGPRELPHEAEVFLLLQQGERISFELRCYDHFGEDFADGFGERLVSGRLVMMIPPKGACLSVANALSHASRRSGSLPTPHGFVCLRIATVRFGKLFNQLGRGGDIEDVVIREFLAVELLEMLVPVPVEGSSLVRVLTVAKLGDERQTEAEAALRLLLLVQVIGNRPIVFRRGDEYLNAEAFAELKRRGAIVIAQAFEDVIVVARVNDHGHAAIIFRCAAEHGGSADVDLFDGLLESDVSLGDSLLERVKIYDDEIDGLDAVGFSLGDMFGVVAKVEEPAVDLGMKRFDPAIHHLGKAV
jgi:hypothetical protein